MGRGLGAAWASERAEAGVSRRALRHGAGGGGGGRGPVGPVGRRVDHWPEVTLSGGRAAVHSFVGIGMEQTTKATMHARISLHGQLGLMIATLNQR